MASTTTGAESAPLTGARSAKDRFLNTYQRERDTTLKVLRAFPADKASFRPHERSKTAHDLAWTFAVEQTLGLLALRRELKLGGGFPPAPDSWDAVLQAFSDGSEAVIAHLRGLSESDLNGTVTFFSAPKQTAEFPIEDFLWFMLHDQIHHRGQMSVYVRLAGGKVPSIYGPSADEPWS